MSETLSPGGCIVVTDDESRIRWTRSGEVVTSVGTWPSQQERSSLVGRLRNGADLLVVVPMSDPSVAAFRDGATFSISDVSGLDDDDLVEIEVPVLDWMPARLRLVGQYHRRSVAAEMAGLPALLRPPLVLRSGSRHVKFAVRTGRGSGATGTALADLADFAFGTRRPRPSAARRQEFVGAS